MTTKKPKSKEEPDLKIIKLPRKNQNFFQDGKLYRLKYNDPDKFQIRYLIISLKKIDLRELELNKETLPATFSLAMAKNLNLTYKIEPGTKVHNSYLMNETFVCLESSVNVLRNFRATVSGETHNVGVFKQVPVFLFHDAKTATQTIGAVDISTNNENMAKLIGDDFVNQVTDDGVFFIENFFERID